jgi:hypothetical protein
VAGAASLIPAALAVALLASGCGGSASDYAANATSSCVERLPEHSGVRGLRVSPTAPALIVVRLDGRPVQAERVTLSFLRPDFGSASGANSADLYFLPDRRSAARFRERWNRTLPPALARRAVQQRRNTVVVWGSAPSERMLDLALGCLRSG